MKADETQIMNLKILKDSNHRPHYTLAFKHKKHWLITAKCCVEMIIEENRENKRE